MSDVHADLTRRHGVKETRAERERRTAHEAREKWQAKLQREDVDKLRDELAALQRARFRAPQQNERMRLVTRMLADLERAPAAATMTTTACSDSNNNADEANVTVPQAPRDDDSDSDNDLAAVIATTATTHARNDDDDAVHTAALRPRVLTRRTRDARDEARAGIAAAAASAEQALLHAVVDDGSDDDLDAFLDRL